MLTYLFTKKFLSTFLNSELISTVKIMEDFGQVNMVPFTVQASGIQILFPPATPDTKEGYGICHFCTVHIHGSVLIPFRLRFLRRMRHSTFSQR
jgi:hypothetical protein